MHSMTFEKNQLLRRCRLIKSCSSLCPTSPAAGDSVRLQGVLGFQRGKSLFLQPTFVNYPYDRGGVSKRASEEMGKGPDYVR